MSNSKEEDKGKEYKYYTLSVPANLRFLFEAYIRKNKPLGYKNVSQYMLHILQKRAEEILEKDPGLGERKKITISSGTYIRQEDGTYKKIKKINED
jgi:hypothetical protein